MISENDLMGKLVMAKKVMNQVDNKTPINKNNSSNVISEDSFDEYGYPINEQSVYIPEVNIPKQEKTQIVDENRINNSKLPDVIKKAMIEKPIPIPHVPLSQIDGNSEFVKKTKKLMESSGVQTSKSEQTRMNVSPSRDLVKDLTPIIENIVRKSIDEILDKKIDQLLKMQQTMSINENLVIKVGDSIFKGKITGVKK